MHDFIIAHSTSILYGVIALLSITGVTCVVTTVIACKWKIRNRTNL